MRFVGSPSNIRNRTALRLDCEASDTPFSRSLAYIMRQLVSKQIVTEGFMMKKLKDPEKLAPKKKTIPPRESELKQEQKLDEALEESFPASDPPSISDPSRES